METQFFLFTHAHSIASGISHKRTHYRNRSYRRWNEFSCEPFLDQFNYVMKFGSIKWTVHTALMHHANGNYSGFAVDLFMRSFGACVEHDIRSAENAFNWIIDAIAIILRNRANAHIAVISIRIYMLGFWPHKAKCFRSANGFWFRISNRCVISSL